MRHRKQHSGFTLIETLVAITILLLSIVGPMSIAATGIKNSNHARDQVVAFYLAQEGIEIIRAIRDENALVSSTEWDADIPPSCKGGGCGIDVQSMQSRAFRDCSSVVSNCNIFSDSDGLDANDSQRGYYTHSSTGNSATTFNRLITITDLGGDEYEVNAKVSWVSHAISKELTVRARIFDQYDNI